MKKSILIITAAIIALSFSAFSYINWNNSNGGIVKTINKLEDSEFFYDLGPRFDGVTKGELAKAESILDFLSEAQAPPVESFKSVTIIIVDHERPTNIRVSGVDDILTEKQLDLLQSADYSTHFSVRAEYKGINEESGVLDDKKFNPYLTIVPEKQAIYINGKESLLQYLRANNKKNLIYLEKDKIRPAMLKFVVNKDKTISNIRMSNHSGYPSMDETMIDLLRNAPGQWAPAENAKGEKVDQELVISFGMVGC